MAGRRCHQMLFLLGIFASWFGHALAVPAAEPFRFREPIASKVPITLSADSISFWEEEGKQILQLEGKVLILHEFGEIKADRVIAWVDRSKEKQAAYPVKLYAEGNVFMDRRSQQQQKADVALFELATTKQVEYRGKLEKKNLADGPLYQMALKVKEQPVTRPYWQAVYVDPKKETLKEKNDGIQQAQFTTPNPNNVLPPPSLQPPTNLNPSPYAPLPNGPSTLPQPTPAGPNTLGPTGQIVIPSGKRTLFYSQRSSTSPQFQISPELVTATGGIKLIIIFTEANNSSVLDIESDNLVVWSNGGGAGELFGAMQQPSGAAVENNREYELYLSGNVILRYGSGNSSKTGIQDTVLRADQIYYDLNRNRAIALSADLEFTRPGLGQTAHVKASEIQQLALNEWRTINAEAAASKLPSDPGLKLTIAEATILEQKQVRRTIFGLPFLNRETGEEVEQVQRRFRGRRVAVQLEDIPVFYLPYLSGNVNDPFGPLEGISFRQDRVFGTQVYTTFDIFELIGVTPLPGEKWSLFADYLSDRGPALGTDYEYSGKQLFGVDTTYYGFLKAYGINDHGNDFLGGPRSNDFQPTDLRGRAAFRHVQFLDEFSFQTQIFYLSDLRFHEQYYKMEFDEGPNTETFFAGKFQRGNFATTLLVEPNLSRKWFTETRWLPLVEGFLLGESLFDRFTYNSWASAAYAQSRPTQVEFLTADPTQLQQLSFVRGVAPALLPTEQRIDTARVDWMQELSLPFRLGALQVAPYGRLDLAAYSQDLTGESRGRVYGGGGVRASLPFSRLYENAESELFNVKGLYHKVVLGGNYYTASSDTPYTMLPQLSRLNDDAVDQALRDINPFQPLFVPGTKGQALQSDPLFNPQLYAIRRLVDTRPDTLDTIQVIQGDLRQRFQTKRGYPGQEHTVDWLTFDLSASFFPAANRDNFGESVSFVEYDGTWYVGDRTGFTTTGWFDPFSVGTRYYTLGAFLNRPDRTNFYVGYRQFDPVRSKAVIASVSYIFSPKYAISANTVYDFGIQEALSSSLVLTRTGTDLTLSLGFSYNAILENFGFTIELVPNLIASRTGGRGLGSVSNPGYGR